jgi:DNA topoisomerase-1
MKNAKFNRLTVEATVDDTYTFAADFEEMVFPGFKKVYEERVEDDEKTDALPSVFPEVKENENLPIADCALQQKFTKPPPRYTESSLVRELESKGIGRPSTYASIVSTIKDKHYVTKEKGHFFATELGETINRLLTEHFPEVMDIKFTASMENELDKVEDGEVDWTELLKNFYTLFERRVKHAQERMRNVRLEQTETGVKCEKCGADMVIRWGKKGKFLACPNYPRCRNTKEYIASSSGSIKVVEEIETDEVCEKCGRHMVVRVSKRGRFLACPGYPECRNSKPLSHGLDCPKEGCEDGKVVERRSRRSGNPYYVCTKYPDCDFLVWDFPVKKKCPKCGAQFLLLSRDGEDRFLRCAREECDYETQIS